MTTHPWRVVASFLFLAGAVIAGVFALAIALAKILVDAGLTVRPSDAALLADLSAMLVFVVAFAALNLVAAIGLLAGKTWADTLGMGTAAVAVAVGATGLVLTVVGGDPSHLTSQATIDGITVLAAFTFLYLAAITVLGINRLPQRATPMGAAA